jgi:hypothetical protein
MRSSDSSGAFALAMIGSALLLGPLCGWWPLVGVVAACGTSAYLANRFRPRR